MFTQEQCVHLSLQSIFLFSCLLDSGNILKAKKKDFNYKGLLKSNHSTNLLMTSKFISPAFLNYFKDSRINVHHEKTFYLPGREK